VFQVFPLGLGDRLQKHPEHPADFPVFLLAQTASRLKLSLVVPAEHLAHPEHPRCKAQRVQPPLATPERD